MREQIALFFLAAILGRQSDAVRPTGRKKKVAQRLFFETVAHVSERSGEFLQRKKRVKPLPSAGAQYFGFAKSSIVCILFLFYH